MNESEHDLKRLLRSAARTRLPVATRPSLRLEQRIIEHWREHAEAVEEWFTHLPLYRRALVVACTIAVVALVLYLPEIVGTPPDDVDLITAPVDLTSLP